jgi:hypothetical protein
VSVTCNVELICIWLHWRETNENDAIIHYMKCIHSCTTWGGLSLDPILKARAILKNHVNYALGDRLQSILNALPGFIEKKHGMDSAAKVHIIRNSTKCY